MMRPSVFILVVVVGCSSNDGGADITWDTFDAAVDQAASGGITSTSCTAAQDAALNPATVTAFNGGIACMKHYGVTDLRDRLVTLLASRPIHYTCTATDACAQASIFDVLS